MAKPPHLSAVLLYRAHTTKSLAIILNLICLEKADSVPLEHVTFILPGCV